MMLMFRMWTILGVNVFLLGAVSLLILLPPTMCSSAEKSLFKRLQMLQEEAARRRSEESVVDEPSPSAAKVVTTRAVTDSHPEEMVSQSVSHLARFIGQLNMGHDELRNMVIGLFEHRHCPADTNRCNNGRQCYQKLRICDGFPDCDDLSDEEDCENESCPLEIMEKCADNKQCILTSDICNGHTDCLDESDELRCDKDDCADSPCRNGGTCNDLVNTYNCTCLPGFIGPHCEIGLCPEGELMCLDGSQCYPFAWRCDGLLDCQDGSDESSCSTHECKDGLIKCENGIQCVPPELFCDNYTHCSDGSDETSCDHDPYNIYLGQTEIFWDYCFVLNGTRCLDHSLCFFPHQECDGHAACPKHYDERFCCPQGQARCQLVDMCISIDNFCNGIHDCPDHSDEDECSFPTSSISDQPNTSYS